MPSRLKVILRLSRGCDACEIEFSGVVLYHFIHTGGAIITDISESPVVRLVLEKKEILFEWWRRHGGIAHWNDDIAAYGARLVETGHNAWCIESTVGFSGFIIGKEVKQK